jgi:hypothetical protein
MKAVKYHCQYLRSVIHLSLPNANTLITLPTEKLPFIHFLPMKLPPGRSYYVDIGCLELSAGM